MTGREMWDLAARVLKGPDEFDTVVSAAVVELTDKYPCPHKDPD